MQDQADLPISSNKRLKRGLQYIHLLPNDLFLLHIISSLPIKDAAKCRLVCKRWKSLISTSYFADFYFQKKAPVILADTVNPRKRRSKVYMLKNWWKNAPLSSVREFKTCHGYSTQCAGAGCIVMKSLLGESSLSEFVVFNPAYRDKVKIIFPENLYKRSEAYAVFFHPRRKEYCILWGVYTPAYVPSGKTYDPYLPNLERINPSGIHYYMILNLGFKPCKRDIKNPWSNRVKNQCKSAVLVNNFIYWLLKPKEHDNHICDDIMEFDVIREEFKLISLSSLLRRDPKNNRPPDYDGFDLLNIGGILALFLVSQKENIVYKFTLKDREKEIWTSCTYPIVLSHLVSLVKTPVRVIAVVDEELLIKSYGRVFAIDLKLGTRSVLSYHDFENFWAYGITFASLKKSCESKIIIEESPFLKGQLLQWGSKGKRSN